MQFIDVYDFDRTLFKHDCYTEFLRYAFSRHRWMWMLIIFPMVGLILMTLLPWSIRLGKRISFVPIKFMDLKKMVPAFWEEMCAKGWIAPWFSPSYNDVPIVVATASPRFLVEPLLTGNLKVHCLLATELDPVSLRITGANNSGREKTRRLLEKFPGCQVRIAGSDSVYHDRALLELALQPTLVRNFDRIPLEIEL